MPIPHRRIAHCLRQSLLTTGLLAAFASQAQSAASIDLPAAPLERSLNALARRTGVQILFASDVAAGKRVQPVRGNLTTRQALDQLLSGQGVEAVERSPGVYVVRPVEAAPAARPAAPKPAVRSPAPQAQAQPQAATLDTIMVTGEKTNRSLQDTTTSVAVITAERIEDENIRDLYDVLGRTANVNLIGDNDGFSIRGMRNTDVGQAPLASIYLDGAALSPDIFDKGPVSSWDLAQVEVLRGPQSTIQGENALAGAVVLRTQDPTMYWDWHARAQYANPADRDVAFAGGGPLIADELAFRVSVQDRQNNGFIYNPTRNTHGNPLDDTVGRAKLLWTPKGLPDLTVKLGLTRDVHAMGAGRVDTSVPDFFDHRLDFSDHPNTDDTRTSVATLEVNYAFSPAWTLTSTSNWTRARNASRYDATNASLAGNGFIDRWDVSETRSQEFRLHHDGEVLEGLLGVYWSQRDNQDYINQVASVATPIDLIQAELLRQGLPVALANAYADIYVQALPVVPYANAGDQPASRDRNEAIFGDGTLHLNDRWSLLGGFRYDRQQYDLGANERRGVFLGTYPDPATFGAPGSLPYRIIGLINQGVGDYLASGNLSEPANQRKFDAFLPKLGVRYAWNQDLSLSFVAQRGYRSGGSLFNLARVQNFEYDPEYTNNYEASLRSLWLDGTLTLNANVYYTDWKDKQVSVQGPLSLNDTFIFNAARAHMSGIELEANQRLNAGLDWYASLGYERTRFDRFSLPADAFAGATLTDYSGRSFAYTPSWTFALGGNWRSERGWFANLNANYRSAVVQTVGTGRELASLVLVNAKAGYAQGGWSTYLFANNLLDRQYFTTDNRSAANFATLSTLGNPRVLGLGVEWRW